MNEMNQAAQPAPSSTPAEQLVKQLCATVATSSTWMKLLGVLLIIDGVFLIFTLVGILICWLPIWLGVILFKAAGDAEAARRGVSHQLTGFVQKINRFFLIAGILALIFIIIWLIVFFVVGMGALWGALGGFR